MMWRRGSCRRHEAAGAGSAPGGGGLLMLNGSGGAALCFTLHCRPLVAGRGGPPPASLRRTGFGAARPRSLLAARSAARFLGRVRRHGGSSRCAACARAAPRARASAAHDGLQPRHAAGLGALARCCCGRGAGGVQRGLCARPGRAAALPSPRELWRSGTVLVKSFHPPPPVLQQAVAVHGDAASSF